MITLVMLSGGLDSTYVLAKMLRETEDELIVHHVNLLTDEGRGEVERQRCEKIVDYCRDHFRPFTYTETTVDHRGFPSFGWDIVTVGFEVGVIARAFGAGSSRKIDRWTIGVCAEDENWGDRFQKGEACCAASAYPVSPPEFFYLDPVTKKEEAEYLQKELLDLTWGCRTPLRNRDGYVECGVCKTCLQISMLRNAEDANLSDFERQSESTFRRPPGRTMENAASVETQNLPFFANAEVLRERLCGSNTYIGVFSTGNESLDEALLNANEVRLNNSSQLPAQIILDFGAGLGSNLVTLIQENGCHVTVADFRHRKLRVLKEKGIGLERLMFDAITSDRFPYETASFDQVWCIERLSQEPKPGYWLSEIARVLKPGGQAIITDYYSNPFSSGTAESRLMDLEVLWPKLNWKRTSATFGLNPDFYEDWSEYARQSFSVFGNLIREKYPRSPEGLRMAQLMERREEAILKGHLGAFLMVMSRVSPTDSGKDKHLAREIA